MQFRIDMLGAVLLAGMCAAAPGAPPETAKRPVTDEHHGTKIVDDYRWLEDWGDAGVKAWSEAQNAHARAFLDSIKVLPDVRARMSELENAVGVEYHSLKFEGGRLFASKSQPPKQQPLVVMLSSLDGPGGEKVILDPNVRDASGGTAFDWFVPSPDGKLVAVSLSVGGSEAGNVHVFEADTGNELKTDRIDRVNGGTAGGFLAWTKDSKGFYYTRYPRAGERPKEEMDFYTRVFFHTLGEDPSKDVYQRGDDYPKIAEIAIEVSHDGKWVLTNVQNGDGGEFIQDLRSPDGAWTRLSTYADRIVEAKFGLDQAVYLVSRKNAPNGKIMRLALEPTKIALSHATEFISERADASVETNFAERTGLYSTKSRLYVQYQVGGPNELRVFGTGGKEIGVVPQLPISTIEGIEPLDASSSDDLVFQNDSFIAPPGYFVFRAGTGDDKLAGRVEPTGFRVPEPPNMPKLSVRREMATSKDGTQVPVNIITRQGAELTKDTPTLIWGYGGYGVNETPGFSRRRVLWVEQGCTFVVANIRGGGEFGERWHLEGNLTKKQNVFDDFHAACTHMISKGYTSKDRLAIMGGSNGGLLMGATFTQHPELCKAVVSSVGIYDMLRVELSANGEFNITEFGTVKNPEHFKALLAYSPYHNVRDGTRYPDILFLTGANDPRVDPMQSRKMTARLQAAQYDLPKAAGGPGGSGLVLLRTSGSTGHGMGTPLNARIEQSADTYGFLFDRLGVAYRPVAGTPRTGD